MIPRFAEPILKARKAGMRPLEMVLVSDGIRDLYTTFPDNPVIVVEPGTRAREYDFRCLAGLEVEIHTEGSDRRAQALAWAISKVRPDFLRVLLKPSGEMFRIITFGIWGPYREHEWVL